MSDDRKGFTLWFTGLSSSGKTTLALLISERLKTHGFPNIEILDGDIVRTNLSKGLGFSKEDRMTNMRRVGFVCHLLTRNRVPNIAALISPYMEIRNEIRSQIGNFIEVYLKCSLEACEKRDVKGLYKKARAGFIKDFTGIDSPYEPPLNPDVICDTEKESPEECADKIIDKLKSLGYFPPKMEKSY